MKPSIVVLVRRWCCLAVLTLCVPFGSLSLQAQQDGASQTTARGALVLVGGGANRPAFMARFIDLAGGAQARIVVIPTSLDDDRLTPEGLTRLDVSVQRAFGPSTSLLHTRDRKVADSAQFVEPLRHATGVWILGGNEVYLADAYAGTRTAAEIKALLARGGVVGGTSAGAVIQGAVLIRAKLVPNPANTPAGEIAILGTRAALDLLPSAVVVPHWSERQANFDLLSAECAKDPSRLGIGIDEDTAALVQGDRLEVLGDHHVGIYDGKTHDGHPYLLLSPGQSYDLKHRTLLTGRKNQAPPPAGASL